jgi:hypothetical protein
MASTPAEPDAAPEPQADDPPGTGDQSPATVREGQAGLGPPPLLSHLSAGEPHGRWSAGAPHGG